MAQNILYSLINSVISIIPNVVKHCLHLLYLQSDGGRGPAGGGAALRAGRGQPARAGPEAAGGPGEDQSQHGIWSRDLNTHP